MTRITPLRRMILQCSQSLFTEARTFIYAIFVCLSNGCDLLKSQKVTSPKLRLGRPSTRNSAWPADALVHGVRWAKRPNRFLVQAPLLSFLRSGQSLLGTR